MTEPHQTKSSALVSVPTHGEAYRANMRACEHCMNGAENDHVEE